MIHQAGPLTNLIQKCVYCSRVLANYQHAPSGEWKGWDLGVTIKIDDLNPNQSCLINKLANCYEVK